MTDEISKKPVHIRRLKFWVNPKVQGAIIGYVLFLMLVSAGILYYGIRRTLEAVDIEALRINPGYGAAIKIMRETRMQALDGFFIFHGIITFVFVAIGAMLLTHRVVGPVYRLKVILQELLDNKKPQTVDFRQGDFLGDIFPLVRELIRRHYNFDKKP